MTLKDKTEKKRRKKMFGFSFEWEVSSSGKNGKTHSNDTVSTSYILKPLFKLVNGLKLGPTHVTTLAVSVDWIVALFA